MAMFRDFSSFTFVVDSSLTARFKCSSVHSSNVYRD